MDGAETEPPVIVTQPKAGVLGGLFAAALIGAAAVFMLVVGVGALLNGALLGLFLAALACFMGVLCLYVVRDTRGKAGWRVAGGTQALDLDLPRGRSLTHRLAAVHARVPYAEIAAIETRLEAYPGLLGLTNMQRTYALKLKTGDVIVLGEDRALRRGLAPSKLADVLVEIARRGNFALRDLGMAVGNPGFLGVLFVAPPRWDAPSISPERQEALWAAAERTARLAGLAAFTTLLNKRG